MAILSWGKPTIQFKDANAADTPSNWRTIDTPKADTTKLNIEAGQEITAIEEGGEVVDSRTAKNTYSFEFDLFCKKGVERPFVDVDGLIQGEFSIRLIPEDPSAPGFQIDRASLRVEQSYTTADGIILHYVAKALKPANGKQVKEYYSNSLIVDKPIVYFTAPADNTGKVVTATSTANVIATTRTEWITTSVAGKATTIKVAQNTSNTERRGTVIITADGKSAIIEVVQIPA